MKYLTLSIGAGLALMAGAAMAQQGDVNQAATSGAQVAANEQAGEEDASLDPREQEVQCRTERVTGSRTRTNRICMTRAEWRALEARSRDDVNGMQRSASGGAQCRMGPNGCSPS